LELNFAKITESFKTLNRINIKKIKEYYFKDELKIVCKNIKMIDFLLNLNLGCC
jgi:hypothetical protein